jgi:tetratricopeptide (TPR) repeat protein
MWNTTRSSRLKKPLFVRMVLLLTLLLCLTITGAAQQAATPGGGRNCTDPVARQFLRQAEDSKRSYDERNKAYESAARICSQDSFIYAGLAALLLQHQDAAMALTWARRGLEIAPKDPTLSVYGGIALLLVGHPDQALTMLKDAPPIGKNEFYIGMAYRSLRRHKEAQKALLQAFTLGFNDPYVLYVLIEQDKALGDKEAGMRDFRSLHERFPDSAWLHMLYGDAYMSKNDDADAEKEYEEVARLAPNLPMVEYELGYIDFKRASYAAAEKHLRKEIATDPAFAPAYLYLGTTLRRLGRDAEALPFLAEAVMRDPNYALAYNELATSQIEAGKLEDALQTLQKGENRFPQETAFPVQLAGLLRRLGRMEEAKSKAEEAMRLSDRNKPPPPSNTAAPIPSLPNRKENQ